MMTSTQKGNAGLSLAIGFFGGKGYTVSVPLTDTQDYDLIVDDALKLQRIQVRYTSRKTSSGAYVVGLRVTSGSSRKVIKKSSDCSYDALFVVCDNKTMYFIPKGQIKNENSLVLTNNLSEYIVKI